MTALRPSMPLGLAYIAAVLEREGHAVSVLDAVAEAPNRVTPADKLHCFGLAPEEIVERVDPDTQVIGVSNMWSFSWPLVRRLIRLLKERYPDKVVIAGGEHFSGMPQRM